MEFFVRAAQDVSIAFGKLDLENKTFTFLWDLDEYRRPLRPNRKFIEGGSRHRWTWKQFEKYLFDNGITKIPANIKTPPTEKVGEFGYIGK